MREKVDFSDLVNQFCESTKRTLSDLTDRYKLLTDDFVEMFDRMKKLEKRLGNLENENQDANIAGNKSIHIGDVCFYKNDADVCFLITSIDSEYDQQTGKRTDFFDAIREDGSVIHDGTLDLVQSTCKNILCDLRKLLEGIKIIQGEF